ncbi:MAG: VOC family protein [Chthoniobacterales bacterium]
MIELEGIDHVALAVRDARRSAEWYVEVLDFEPRHEGMWDGVPLFVGKGTTALALFPISSTKSAPPAHGARFLHLAFRTHRKGFESAQRELNHRGIAFRFEDHAISHSIYFADPDGHALEITTYDV